jgi:hypothetical protein
MFYSQRGGMPRRLRLPSDPVEVNQGEKVSASALRPLGTHNSQLGTGPFPASQNPKPPESVRSYPNLSALSHFFLDPRRRLRGDPRLSAKWNFFAGPVSLISAFRFQVSDFLTIPLIPDRSRAISPTITNYHQLSPIITDSE